MYSGNVKQLAWQ